MAEYLESCYDCNTATSGVMTVESIGFGEAMCPECFKKYEGTEAEFRIRKCQICNDPLSPDEPCQCYY